MTARPYQALTEKMLNTKNKIVGSFVRSPKSAEDFNNLTNTLLYNITNHLTNLGGKPEDIREMRSDRGSDWTQNMSDVRSGYVALYRAYENLINEEKIINRIETRAHIRALLFRFLTTLAIGAGIMITYYLAHKWSIPLPFSRSLTSGL